MSFIAQLLRGSYSFSNFMTYRAFYRAIIARKLPFLALNDLSRNFSRNYCAKTIDLLCIYVAKRPKRRISGLSWVGSAMHDVSLKAQTLAKVNETVVIGNAKNLGLNGAFETTVSNEAKPMSN